VVSTQNSLDTLKGDVAAVTRALRPVGSPAILVGHSYGGTVITAAGTDDRVAGLVYIAALAPDDGETSAEPAGPVPPHRNILPHRNRGRARLDAPHGVGCFAGDRLHQSFSSINSWIRAQAATTPSCPRIRPAIQAAFSR